MKNMKILLQAIGCTIGIIGLAFLLGTGGDLIAHSKYQFQIMAAIFIPLIILAFYITIKEETKTEKE
jgi:hypothetical protein